MRLGQEKTMRHDAPCGMIPKIMGVRGKNVVRRSGGGVTRATRPGPWLVEDLSRDAHPGQHAAREVCKDLTLTLQDRAVLGKRPENQLRAYRCLRDAHCTIAWGRMNSLAGRVPSEGGTKDFGAAAFSFLARSSAARAICVGSATAVDVLCHAGENLINLIGSGIGRDVNF